MKKYITIITIVFMMIFSLSISIFSVFSSSKIEEQIFSNDEWYKVFGGKEIDRCDSFIQTDDGYVMIGGTYSYGNGGFDVWLIKTDFIGNMIWNKTFGGSKGDFGKCVIKDDNGYLIGGYTESLGESLYNLWLIKTDSNGNEIWNKTFGGNRSGWVSCILEVEDGYLVVGSISQDGRKRDIYLMKIDRDGNEVWNHTYGGDNSDFGNRIIPSADGNGYIILGSTISFGAGFFDIWLIKVDDQGNMIWSRTFGDRDSDRGEDIISTGDGYVVVGESTLPSGGWDDIVLMKVDINGNMIWSKLYGGDSEELGKCVTSIDDGYIISGVTAPYGLDFDAWLIRTDSQGNMIWNKTFGGMGDDNAFAVLPYPNGGYIFVGAIHRANSSHDAWLVRCLDYPPPAIDIIRPKNGFLYVGDKGFFKIGETIVIGDITSKVDLYDPDSRVYSVDFTLFGPYIDDHLVTLDTPPYEYKFTDPAIGLAGIMVIAHYSNNTAYVSDEISFWMLNK